MSVWCGKVKIGFVPRTRNQELAKMLFFRRVDAFEAYVESTDWAQHPERQVRMVAYVRDRQ
ncbi:MAG: hypothetical protein IKG18_12070 [Atopobiaceae bacterium]|nr:hypothetical protein [Atopobiaceae bacterium]